MSRRGKTYNRIARDLIMLGEDLARNGRDLAELEAGAGDSEGRIREWCGRLVADVGRMFLQEAHHRKTMGRMRKIGRIIRKAIRDKQHEEPCK